MRWRLDQHSTRARRGWRLLLCLIACGALLAPGRHTRAMGAAWQVVPWSGTGPEARSQYGMAADGSGHLFLYGGNAGVDAPLADFWEYDTATGAWQQIANDVVPPLIEPHLAVDGQGDVWEFGGIAAPGAPHLTGDGHSFGLYEYQPASGVWRDMTTAYAASDLNWPPGREDHGFAYDPRANDLVVFAGEGQGDAVLNDLWTYSLQDNAWTQVAQQYAGSSGQPIAPREIYNISADSLGHLYLFGGSYLASPAGAGTNAYANDLWRYDDATQTWTLLAGVPNGYDPSMPLPRHYYGQTVDADGDFDILGGYLDEPATPPFFSQDSSAGYALPFQFTSGQAPGTYGLSDFWQFDPATGWHDLSASLGPLGGSPMIPYGLVFDRLSDRLYTFGGFHLGQDGLLEQSNMLWAMSEGDPAPIPPPATATPSATATPPATATVAPTVTFARAASTPSATATSVPVVARATPTATATRAPGATQPAPAGTIKESLRAGPYRLTLAIGPPEQIYSEAQLQRAHPRSGEVLLGGASTGVASIRSMPLTRSLALYVSSVSTGAPIAAAAVTVAVYAPGSETPEHVPVLVLQGIGAGPGDRHFGNNAALPSGPYRIVVRVNRTSATFDIAAPAGRTGAAPPRSP